MSVSSTDELFEPAHRPSEGTTITTSPNLGNQKSCSMSDRNAQSRNVGKDNINQRRQSKENKDINKYKDKSISPEIEDNRNNGLSSNSSGSFGSLGDNSRSHQNSVSTHESSYPPAAEANLPLEVINPILDLVDEDEDDDAFGMPLSQQDEKLLEELLR